MTAPDEYERYSKPLDGPALNVIVGWLLDAELPKLTRYIRVTADGDLSVAMLDQSNQLVNHVIPGLKAGNTLPFRVHKINTSGTSIPTPTTNIQLYY